MYAPVKNSNEITTDENASYLSYTHGKVPSLFDLRDELDADLQVSLFAVTPPSDVRENRDTHLERDNDRRRARSGDAAEETADVGYRV